MIEDHKIYSHVNQLVLWYMIFLNLNPCTQLIECPSIYEMLPNPGFKWNEQPLIQVWRKQPEKEEDSQVELESYGPIECPRLFEEALKDNEVHWLHILG